MILTVCIFTFASLVAVDPVSEECFRTTDKDLAIVTAMCAKTDKDPLSTCEVQRVGATKYYIRVRHLAGTSDEGTVTTSSVKKEQA